MLRDDIARYTELSGNDGEHTSIGIIGAFLDGYETGLKDRPKGEWIRFKEFEEGYFHIKCSKCGQYWSIDSHAKIFKYCFNCGADMRGE